MNESFNAELSCIKLRNKSKRFNVDIERRSRVAERQSQKGDGVTMKNDKFMPEKLFNCQSIQMRFGIKSEKLIKIHA